MIARILYHYYRTIYLTHHLNTVEKLRAHQNKQFKKLVKHTLCKSPFYEAYLDKPLQAWPIINKKIMMAHFDEINTLNIKKQDAFDVALRAEKTRDFSPLINNIAVGLSSGTSGSRGLFLVSPKERDAWAGAMLAKILPNGLRTHERIAFFLRANNKLYTTLNRGGKIKFHFFDLLGDFDEHMETLNTLQPTILSGPASVLLLLAQHKNRLNIKPKKILSVAEVLEPGDEAVINHAFGCEVSQVYQCTEGFLAVSDKHTNTLVMNEESLIIEKEWLDEHRFVPIITDLKRTSQPIVRYRLDDVLVAKDSRSVFTELSAIEGRVGDICYGTQGDETIPIFADTIRQQMASSPIDFQDYQITQYALNAFSIQVYPELLDKEQLIEHLNQLFKQKKCDIPSWDWRPFEKREMGIKRQRIQSKL